MTMFDWDEFLLEPDFPSTQESYERDPTYVSAQAKGARVFSTPIPYQELSDKIWDLIVSACDDYFYNGVNDIAGDEDAPYMEDSKVNDQFEYFDLYRTDSGALIWSQVINEAGVVKYTYTNKGRTPYVFTDLPMNIKRALCQRIWKLCKEAELEKDHIYINGMQRMRNDL